MNNVTIILFGATGDLSRRMIIPSLYRLFVQKRVGPLVIIGVAKEDVQPAQILQQSREFIKNVDEQLWLTFSSCFYYQQVDVAIANDFLKLRATVRELEVEHGMKSNFVFYCAVASYLFCSITKQLCQSGLMKNTKADERPWQRIVYEKPFGRDSVCAHAINECIYEYIDESQVYRIDHYLTKELVSNIALIRFTNCVFEPLWNNRYIDHVQIILSEQLTVDQRGAFYDQYGAVADVVQNHMMQLVALIGMEAPQKLSGEHIRNQRARVLQKVHVIDALYGQYQDYTKEAHVSPQSTTETFAALMLRIENPRWAGVPFYLKTGKALAKKETVIHIKFKSVDCLLAACPIPSNWLTIKVSPEAVFSLSLNAKKPGENAVAPMNLEFCHSCLYGEFAPESYDTLFEEIIRGEQSVSVRFDEIEYAWNIVDQLKGFRIPLYVYEKRSNGPKELADFENKHGMKWRS